MDNFTRLDILLYAHDGRGFGHASRTIAIGLALRRIFPSLKILFLSGCKISQELIGDGLLDWIKLPSYETVVTDGRSKGITGNSNFEDKELGTLRGEQIEEIVKTYRPRLILADHSPQGKHRELLPALKASKSTDTTWILGMRGIPGKVSQLRSDLATSVFSKHYHSMLWYGDTQILGTDQIDTIRQQYNVTPVECGYVSRITELMKISTTHFSGSALAGTISIPWMGENSHAFLLRLAAAIKRIGPQHGTWKLFVDNDHPYSHNIFDVYDAISFCQIEQPGQRYISALMRSRMALIYGGYNSSVDILSLSLPAIIILRDMQDNEQQIHIQKLLGTLGDNIIVLTEFSNEEELFTALYSQSQNKSSKAVRATLDGAETAAIHLASVLKKNR